VAAARDAQIYRVLHWTLFGPKLKLLKQSPESVTVLKHETRNGKMQV